METDKRNPASIRPVGQGSVLTNIADLECTSEVDDKSREQQEPPDVTTIGNRKISA